MFATNSGVGLDCTSRSRNWKGDVDNEPFKFSLQEAGRFNNGRVVDVSTQR